MAPFDSAGFAPGQAHGVEPGSQPQLRAAQSGLPRPFHGIAKHLSAPYSCQMQLKLAAAIAPKTAALQADSLALHEALADLVRAYQFRDRDRICCHDISVTQCYALEALKRDGPMRLIDLADRLFLDKSTSSRVLAALVRKGYAERMMDLTDGRAISVRITAKGQKLYNRIHDDLVRQQTRMIADLAPEVRRAAIEIISRCARAAEGMFGIGRVAATATTCCRPLADASCCGDSSKSGCCGSES